jgi:hypothetical protein
VAYIVHIEAVRKPHVIGYVTKYLTKSLSHDEKGVPQEEREGKKLALDDEGNLVEERQTYTVELTSKARRIRYSRHFFPERVMELRARLFAEIEQESMEQAENVPADGPHAVGGKTLDETSVEDVEQEKSVDTSEQAVAEEGAVKRSSWIIVECDEFTDDIKEYRRRRRRALLEALLALQEGQKHLSRRVINIWAYQRILRKAG